MKKLFLVLLIVLYGLSGCKKDRSVPAEPAPAMSGSVTTLDLISTDVVTAGLSVNLIGSGIPVGIKIYFNGVEGTVQFSNASMLSVLVPITTSGRVTAVIGRTRIDGPAFRYMKAPVISTFSPAMITEGTEVSITGTDLQVAGFTTTVSFGGVPAQIRSLSPTAIMVTAPKTINGRISVALTSQIAGLSEAYIYTSPALLVPYSGGNVAITTQSDADVFSLMNKGRTLQITGDLSIVGTGISSLADLPRITSVSGGVILSQARGLTDAPFLNTLTQAGSLEIRNVGLSTIDLNALNGFTGKIDLEDLDHLTQLRFDRLTTPSYVSIYQCPLLRDLSCLSQITATDGFNLTGVGMTNLTVDRLVTTGAVSVSTCPNLTALSFHSLKSTTGTYIAGISVAGCPAMNSIDLSALTQITGTLMLRGTAINNMNGFRSLTSAGSLHLVGNNQLTNIADLKNMRTINLPAVTSGARAGSVMFNGMELSDNPKLISLNGLENIASLPMLTLNGNTALDDLCPFKKQLLLLNTLPVYVYKYTPCCDAPLNYYVNGSKAALTLVNNGHYATQEQALDALAQCQ